MSEKRVLFNTKKAHAFLKAFRDNEGYINLVSINPINEEIYGITRLVGHIDLATFIEKHNGKNNLYFMVNSPYKNSVDDKLKKTDVERINAVWIDADPAHDKPLKEERARLTKFAEELKVSEYPPTYIIDSGGGFQAFWVLEKSHDATDDNIKTYESLSRGLSVKYNTDKVQNIDRIMRIPFTLNVPSAKKIKRGRTESPATVFHAKSALGIRHRNLDFIEPAEVEVKEQDAYADVNIDMTQARLPISVELMSKFQRTMRKNKKMNDVWSGHTSQFKPSRSELDMTLTRELKYEGYSLQDVGSILCNFQYGSVNQKEHHKQKREIVRTYNRVIDNAFNELSADQINAINKQVNPITKAKEEKIIAKSKRRGLIHISQATYKTSGIPLIKELFDQNSLVMLYGPPNSGKSFITLDIGVAIASNQPQWDQFKIKKQMGVLVVCGEAGQSYGKRVQAVRNKYNIQSNTPYATVPFAHLDNYYDLFGDKDHLKEIEDNVLELEKKSGIKCGLIIVDTLSSTFGCGNENDSKDARIYLNNLRILAEKLSLTILIVHHTGKEEGSGARGSSVFLGDVDTQLCVQAVKKGAKWERTLVSTKQRDSDRDKTTRFGLNIVELAKDEEGDPITTCTVVLEDDDMFDDVTPDTLEGLSDGEKAVFQAAQLYLACDKSNIKLSKIQVLTLLHKDIKNCIGSIVNANKMDETQLVYMAKPDDASRKNFTRDKKKLMEMGASNPDITDEIKDLLYNI